MISILSDLLQNDIIREIARSTLNNRIITLYMPHIFHGQFFFVMKFFGGVLLVFLCSGIIGELLHLDRAYKSDSDRD
jgi:hypothetical protein